MGSRLARIAILFLVTRALLVGAALVPWPLARCIEYEVRAEDGRVLEVVRIPWHVFKTGEGDEHYYIHPPMVLDSFARMDAESYLQIAAFGYARGPDGSLPQHAGFFPGYPLAVRGVAAAINAARGHGGEPLEAWPVVALSAAFLTSNLALLLAALALFRLGRLFLDEDAAERAACWLLACPVAFFGSAFLAESLFLWLSIESVASACRRRMARAALFGALAAFTRPVGVLLVVPLFLLSLRARAGGRAVLRDSLLMLAVPAGALAVVLWHSRALGDPWAYLAVQGTVFGHARFPDFAGFASLFRISGKDALTLARDGCQVAALAIAAACVVPLLPSAARKTPAALAVWALVSLAFVALSGHLISLPRYTFAVFPLFVGAALLVPPGRATRVALAASVLLQVAGFVVFTRAWPVLV